MAQEMNLTGLPLGGLPHWLGRWLWIQTELLREISARMGVTQTSREPKLGDCPDLAVRESSFHDRGSERVTSKGDT